jgi:hypothetical protein
MMDGTLSWDAGDGCSIQNVSGEIFLKVTTSKTNKEIVDNIKI